MKRKYILFSLTLFAEILASKSKYGNIKNFFSLNEFNKRIIYLVKQFKNCNCCDFQQLKHYASISAIIK